MALEHAAYTSSRIASVFERERERKKKTSGEWSEHINHRADIIIAVSVVGKIRKEGNISAVISRTKDTPLYLYVPNSFDSTTSRNICFWRFAFFSACAFAIFSWNVKEVVAFLFLLGRGTVVVFVASSSSVEADFGAAAAFVLSFLLFLVLKDFDVDIFVHNKIMESKEERGEYRGGV